MRDRAGQPMSIWVSPPLAVPRPPRQPTSHLWSPHTPPCQDGLRFSADPADPGGLCDPLLVVALCPRCLPRGRAAVDGTILIPRGVGG